MLKHIHLLFVAVLVVSFVGRVMLAEFRPALMKQKCLKIMPHVLDTLLLCSGIALVIRGGWLTGDCAWLMAKLLALLLFIGLGVLAMRNDGAPRWLAFVGALLCLSYIVGVAISKQAWFFH